MDWQCRNDTAARFETSMTKRGAARCSAVAAGRTKPKLQETLLLVGIFTAPRSKDEQRRLKFRHLPGFA
jgi:hypothetical protein